MINIDKLSDLIKDREGKASSLKVAQEGSPLVNVRLPESGDLGVYFDTNGFLTSMYGKKLSDKKDFKTLDEARNELKNSPIVKELELQGEDPFNPSADSAKKYLMEHVQSEADSIKTWFDKQPSGRKFEDLTESQRSGLVALGYQVGLGAKLHSKNPDISKTYSQAKDELLNGDPIAFSSRWANEWSWGKQFKDTRTLDFTELMNNKPLSGKELKEQYDFNDNGWARQEETPVAPRELASVPKEAQPVQSTQIDDGGWQREIPATGFGGKKQDTAGTLEALRDISVEGMGNDLVNKWTDRNSVGLILQNIITASETTGRVDENYDPQAEPELYTELTKDMSNDQLKELLDGYSNNRHDFIVGASAINGYNQRASEMDDYSKNHPVLSGVNSVTSMLSEAAVFAPISTAIASASASLGVTALSDLSLANRLKFYGIGEAAEQTLQEVVWAKYDRQYSFDPKMFGFGMLAGVGLKSVTHNAQVDKVLRDIFNNEKGFIKFTTEEGLNLVDEVSKRVTDEKAIAFAKRFEEKKLIEIKRIRSALQEEVVGLEDLLDVAKTDLKQATKGTPVYKKLKSDIQKMNRKLKALDAKLPNEMKMLADGSHPLLGARVNPQLTIKSVAEGLEIPNDIVNSPEKLRVFLGLNSPDISDKFIIEGEKSYTNIMRRQLSEMADNKRLNANETIKALADKIGDNKVGNALHDLASTDGFISRVLFNKGNLVSSENPHVAAFYNWLAPDGMGRTGASKIRAIESQQKYNNIFGSELMDAFHTHGDELYNVVKGMESGIKSKFLAEFNFDDYENTVVDMFKKRLILGKEGFADAIGNEEISRIADEFADSFNRMNNKILDRAKKLGVEGVDFDTTEDWFHRSWDFKKARAVKLPDLENSVFRGMRDYLDDNELLFSEADLRTEAKKFAYGLQNADITTIEEANKDYIKFLGKLEKRTKSTEAQGVLQTEIQRLEKNKLSRTQGDLAHRTRLNLDAEIHGTDMTLGDLLEDNFINTQKRYNSRMAARIAAAEHGVKNIDTLDEWVDDAIKQEVKRLADKGVENPRAAAKHAEVSMKQDLQSFKNGTMTGLGDIQDDNASDLLRFIKKYNYASLMQYVGISSIAELSGTVAEAGVNTTFKSLKQNIMPIIKRRFTKNPSMFVDQLYNDMRAFTGIGIEDYAFSSRGTSKGNRIFKTGTLSTVESGLDVLGRSTQGAFGHIETIGRRATNNALAIQWADHFNGKSSSDGILSGFFGSKRVSNRVLENAGLGTFDADNKFVFNELYDQIKNEFKSKATYDSRGNLVKLNMNKWDTDIAHKFGDVLFAQSSHIFVNPDATTMALWQSSTVGQILNQFRTFTINAATKVAGHSLANAQQGLRRGDYTEMYKLGSKIFWGTTLGMLSVSIRDNIKTLGDGTGVNTGLFDEGAMKAAAIGLSRSSIVGQLPTLIDTVGTRFGNDPFFEKSSSIGRSKDFFNLSTTPTGQAIGNNINGVTEILKGNVGKGGMKLLKSSPFYRQIGVQQFLNFTTKED